ncbi:histidine kinase [Maridesulfovibrio ferrireducens]|uniref:histidine kinase n=1 Tax=Maridesulfovibrio ferrireducens TaxID=246191 RepID=UPI001A28E06F|nr:histidine kinase [Maridesulfovibrio ferrireducens]MBI9112149.1 histidine kinase [Maridesulfovibrio ferrireducens]
MSEDESLIEEFFSEVNDKYYPQVLEGIDLLDEQQIEEGIEILSRPLHTIKGVTGFMSGFEPASAFTHKVESFLKKMQSGEVGRALPQIALAIESVNSIFILIEQLRNTGSYDTEFTSSIEQRLLGEDEVVAGPIDNGLKPIEIESIDNCEIIILSVNRLYFSEQREAVKKVLQDITNQNKVLFDFSNTLSVGSSLFELIASFSDNLEIGITGMNGFCSSTFHSWGFSRYIAEYDSREIFLSNNNSGANG